jgi:hypothetical protein
MAKRRKTLHFKSRRGYRDWLAFKHIHLPRSHGKDKIIIGGHVHKVKHGR